MSRRRWFLPGSAMIAAGMIALATPAAALDADEIGVFPTWSVSGSAGAFTATPTFAPSASFPATTLTSTSTSLPVASGASAFLGPGTAFGAEFGSSRAQPYVSIATAAGQTNSTTTLSFASAPSQGWGFALGDVDADWVFVQAYSDAARTTPLTVEQLGFQGAENYCAVSPRPSTCGSGPFTDAPVWVTTPETFDGINYVPGTLRGNSLPGAPAAGRDTAGAYGWFVPTVPVQALVLTFGRREGIPTTQFWMAAPAPKVVLQGTVDVPGAAGVPTGTTVEVADAAGEPLLDIEGAPLQVPVDPATGSYTIELEQADSYELTVIPPDGYDAPAPIIVPGTPDDPQTLVVDVPTLVIDPIVAPTPTATPTPEPELAVSGANDTTGPTGMAAVAMIVIGGLLFAQGRRGTRHPSRSGQRL